jgi:hypothetical protein
MPLIEGKIDLDGAVVTVRVEAGAAEEAALRDAGEEAQYVTTTALIDTGASQTALAPWVVEYLKIQPHGIDKVRVPGRGDEDLEFYDARITLGFPRFDHPRISVLAPGISPASPGVGVLIGRDVLEHFTLVYDGPRRKFALGSAED